MYSRFSAKDSQAPIQIPEHYSGCAFSATDGRTEKAPLKSAPPLLEVARPSPDPTHVQESPPRNDPPTGVPQESSHTTPSAHDVPVSSSKAPRLLGNLGLAFPFSHGVGFEELLLLGLIFLLAQGDADSSTVLLLALLLFCD